MKYNCSMKSLLIDQLTDLFSAAAKQSGITNLSSVTFAVPADVSHGDLATPVALQTFGVLKKSETETTARSPRELAEQLKAAVETQLKTTDLPVASLSVAGPGFINITLDPAFFITAAAELTSPGKELATASKSSDSVLIEYVSPNTNKPLHIGHLRNAALGLAVANLLEKTGQTVHRAIEYNDRGLHIIKSEWAYLQFAARGSFSETEATRTVSQTPWQELLKKWQADSQAWITPTEMSDERRQKPDHFLGYWYTQADQFVGDAAVEQVWAEMLQAWEDVDSSNHKAVRALWEQLNGWFYEGYNQTMARFGARFDKQYTSYESQIYKAGKEIILDAVEQGTFTRLEDGAVKAELEEKYNLPDKVLLRRDGTGIYMTFDIELARQRAAYNLDHLMYIVGSDQKLYFQQLFAVAEMLGLAKREAFEHFAYGMVRLPEGKMSSRKGLVVYGDDVLDQAVARAKEVMQESAKGSDFSPEEFDKTAEEIGLGAVKWTMLSQDPLSDITFNLEESVSFTGFAGPYVQYTFARTQSILRKAENRGIALYSDALLDILMQQKNNLDAAELSTLRSIAEYIDIVERSATERAPHKLCTYLYELCQNYNRLYAELPVLPAEGEEAQPVHQLRLTITQAVATVLRDGLQLLSITPVERM